MLLAAEARAEVANKCASDVGVIIESRISDLFNERHDRIKELSRAKLSLADEILDNNAEIERLKQKLAALSTPRVDDWDEMLVFGQFGLRIIVRDH